MEGLGRIIAAPNLLSICVDKITDGEHSGVMWHLYQDLPVAYNNTMDLLRKMEQFFDEWNFPQSSTISRSFHNGKNIQERPRDKKEAAARMDVQDLLKKKGEEATFIVHVKFRQNATWQGEVIWADKKEKRCFRSALELLKLMDSAMESTTDNTMDRDETEQEIAN